MLDISKLAKRAEYARGILKYLSAQRGQALAEHSLLLAFVAAGSVTLLGALGLLIAAHINSLTIGLP